MRRLPFFLDKSMKRLFLATIVKWADSSVKNWQNLPITLMNFSEYLLNLAEFVWIDSESQFRIQLNTTSFFWIYLNVVCWNMTKYFRQIFRKIQNMKFSWTFLNCSKILQQQYEPMHVCAEVLWPSQPNGVMQSTVSLPNDTFTGQA